jgi:hypothetical protein
MHGNEKDWEIGEIIPLALYVSKIHICSESRKSIAQSALWGFSSGTSI